MNYFLYVLKLVKLNYPLVYLVYTTVFVAYLNW